LVLAGGSSNQAASPSPASSAEAGTAMTDEPKDADGPQTFNLQLERERRTEVRQSLPWILHYPSPDESIAIAALLDAGDVAAAGALHDARDVLGLIDANEDNLRKLGWGKYELALQRALVASYEAECRLVLPRTAIGNWLFRCDADAMLAAGDQLPPKLEFTAYCNSQDRRCPERRHVATLSLERACRDAVERFGGASVLTATIPRASILSFVAGEGRELIITRPNMDAAVWAPLELAADEIRARAGHGR
jgi:hypothetical protein